MVLVSITLSSSSESTSSCRLHQAPGTTDYGGPTGMAASPWGRRPSHPSLPTLPLTVSSCIAEAGAHSVLPGYQTCQHLREGSEFHLTPLVGNLPSWRAACATCHCPAAVQFFPTALWDKTIDVKCGDTKPKLPDTFQFQKIKLVEF